MELNDLLNATDADGANVDKLEGVWKRVEPMIPNGAIWNANTPEFDDLERTGWSSAIPFPRWMAGRSRQTSPTRKPSASRSSST